MDVVASQVREMREAAVASMVRYRRIAGVLESLESVVSEAKKPQNAAVRRLVASAVGKTAGVFAQVDSVEDLDKPLEAIEKAVSSLYGNPAKNSSLYFGRRGKGHHGDPG